ncbi:hypothetical protein BKA70DRAFT_229798 [Coprinopsis sp. MPI-PUGE-AT-0042]|nr:hypothetical protein BKA70DRAFT_229798 [Coprinopsis sp. MPI-PUGE-AT-0042]
MTNVSDTLAPRRPTKMALSVPWPNRFLTLLCEAVTAIQVGASSVFLVQTVETTPPQLSPNAEPSSKQEADQRTGSSSVVPEPQSAKITTSRSFPKTPALIESSTTHAQPSSKLVSISIPSPIRPLNASPTTISTMDSHGLAQLQSPRQSAHLSEAQHRFASLPPSSSDSSDYSPDASSPDAAVFSAATTPSSAESAPPNYSFKFSGFNSVVVTSTPVRTTTKQRVYHALAHDGLGIFVPNATKNPSSKPASQNRPTPCAFFSSPSLENVDLTRILWRRRLEIARRRQIGTAITPSRAAELKRKAISLQTMHYIEKVQWDIPSEFDQYLFLLRLQAKEREEEEKKERARRRGDEDDWEDEEDEGEEDYAADTRRYVMSDGYGGHEETYAYRIIDERGASKGNYELDYALFKHAVSMEGSKGSRGGAYA